MDNYFGFGYGLSTDPLSQEQIKTLVHALKDLGALHSVDVDALGRVTRGEVPYADLIVDSHFARTGDEARILTFFAPGTTLEVGQKSGYSHAAPMPAGLPQEPADATALEKLHSMLDKYGISHSEIGWHVYADCAD